MRLYSGDGFETSSQYGAFWRDIKQSSRKVYAILHGNLSFAEFFEMLAPKIAIETDEGYDSLTLQMGGVLFMRFDNDQHRQSYLTWVECSFGPEVRQCCDDRLQKMSPDEEADPVDLAWDSYQDAYGESIANSLEQIENARIYGRLKIKK